MQTLGFFGLGAMGAGMAANLKRAGFAVYGWDLSEEVREAHLRNGGELCEPAGIFAKAACIVTSLPSSDSFVRFCEETALPACRAGQVIINTGTVSPPIVRELAARFMAKDAFLIDAPVTGGVGGAAKGHLRFFVSGDEQAFERTRGVFEAMGDSNFLRHCGEAGAGQLVKGVNQLGMGLANAAMIEAVAFGVNAGIDPGFLAEMVGGDDGWRLLLRKVCEKAASGNAADLGIKAGQFGYFLEEAKAKGFRMPVIEALDHFLEDKEACIKEANRMSPSYWNELVKK